MARLIGYFGSRLRFAFPLTLDYNAVSMNVLISSAGRRVALVRCFRQGLGALGLSGRVLAADITRLSSAFHAADEGFVVPRCTAPEFVPAVLELCEREGIGLVVPTIDTELPVYAAHRERFARAGVTVAVSSPEVVDIGGDKVATHRWLEDAGLPTVRQGSLAEVQANPAAWPVPFIIKPIFGSSSIGVQRVESHHALATMAQPHTYVAQELARGTEYTTDILVSRAGHCLCAVPRKRLEVRAGEVSKGVTVKLAPLMTLAQQLTQKLPGPYGVLNFQAFVDEQGGMRIIEINPRFGGGFPLTSEAGAPYAQWLIEDVLGLPQSACFDAWQDGLTMLRYDDAVFVPGLVAPDPALA